MAIFRKKQQPQEPAKPYKYGFVLSGGAAKCFAHLGVLKAFNEKGIRPDIVAGTSAGAIAAAFIADGYEPEQIVGFFDRLTFRDFTDFVIPQAGISKTTKLQAFVEKHLRAKNFEELKLPLYLSLSDFDKGEAVYFSKGPLADPVVASCCVPIVYTPKVIGGTTYVDGGLFDNLPVKPIRDLCETVVGIEVNPLISKPHDDSLKEVINRTITMIVRSSARDSYDMCDILLCPQELENYTMIDVNKARKIFEVGYAEARKYFDERGM